MNAANISVLIVARDESRERLTGLLERIAASTGVDDVEVVVAGPPHQLRWMDSWTCHGAVSTVTVVANPSGERSRGLNLGLAACTRSIVCRLDARTRPGVDYLARCAARLATNPSVGVVGGGQRPVAGDGTVLGRGIARALRNPWMLGGARYRRPGSAGPVDTVYLGAFRRDELRAVGGWDPALQANEDYDLCQRYRATGASVWLEAGLVVDYEARTSLRSLASQYFAFGVSKADYWRLRRERPAPRQLVALLLGLTGVAGLPWVLARPGRALVGGAAAVAALAAVDHVADPTERDGRVRTGSLLASVLLVVSWLGGIARGATRRPGA